jgi:hypothetical protein
MGRRDDQEIERPRDKETNKTEREMEKQREGDIKR